MKSTKLLLLASFALAIPVAHAATIFSHTFDPAATGDLNTTSPDTGSVNWVATPTNFLANGTIGGTGAGTATLAFTPTVGLIYTLDASFTGITGDANWIPFGFANGQGTSASTNNDNPAGSENRFLEGQTVGVAWMHARGANADPIFNQAHLGNTSVSSNGGIASSEDWTALSTATGSIDMRIVLDTTAGAGAWTATWYAKLDSESGYTEVRATTDLLSKDITSVGFGKSNTGVSGTIESFSLTSIPEPSTALLGGLGLLALLRRRR